MVDKRTEQEKLRDAEIAKYSRDYDMSMVIKWSFTLFGVLMIGLMLMEAYNRWVIPDSDSEYLTAEIIHTIFGFIGGWCSSVVMYFFAKKMQQQESERGETGPQWQSRKEENR